MDSGDGRYSPEIVSLKRVRRRKKKVSKIPSAQSPQQIQSYKGFESPNTSPSLLKDPVALCFENHNPISLAELCGNVLNNTQTRITSRTKSSFQTTNSSPLSLAKMCINVINTHIISSAEQNTHETIFGENFDDSSLLEKDFSVLRNTKIINEDLRTSIDSYQEDAEYYVTGPVILLQDSERQPSLNTMINQDLEEGPSSPNFDYHRHESPLNINSPMTIPSCSNERDVFLGPLATDEMDHTAASPCSVDGDFSPDDGDSDYQPNEVVSHSSSESPCYQPNEEVRPSSPESISLGNDESVTRKRKRAKRGRANKENWISETNKVKRMKGKTYEGRRKTEEGKIVFDISRNQRSLKPRCLHTETSKYYECSKVTEQDRELIFNDYWKLSWQGKRVWIKQTVRCQSVSRRKCGTDNARRNHTYKYTLNTPEARVTVCKKMYLNTLDVGEWTVHNWSRGEAHKTHKTERNRVVQNHEENGRKFVREYLNALPKLESHYCRKSTTKLYLKPIWNSKQSVYREYLNYITMKGKEEFKVSNFIFWEEFEAMNLSLFSPKKDECDVCCAKRVGNLSNEKYTVHIQRKETARREKDTDKDISDSTVKVFTFDLQAVLLSPMLNASALYYKTKLKVHNFTIYDLKTSDAFCFIWNESEGGVTADEFASILYHFLNNYIDSNVKHVIFWSDGCTNQNRNAILANALLLVAVQKNIIITHKYLEKGHTQMECDSMHSTIERKLKNREIYSPAQYVEVCRNARLTKEKKKKINPYSVHYLQHTFFQKFNTLPYIHSIRPETKVGDATVFDLRCIQYRSDGTIHYKKMFSDNFTPLPKKIKLPSQTDRMPSLYESRIAIPRSKFIHLQELKAVLPIDVHPFYDQLPHQCSDQRRNNSNTICSCRRIVVLPD